MSTEKVVERTHSGVGPDTTIGVVSEKLFKANPKLKDSLDRASGNVMKVAEVVANNLKKK